MAACSFRVCKLVRERALVMSWSFGTCAKSKGFLWGGEKDGNFVLGCCCNGVSHAVMTNVTNMCKMHFYEIAGDSSGHCTNLS